MINLLERRFYQIICTNHLLFQFFHFATSYVITYYLLYVAFVCFYILADRQNHINGIENFWNQAKRVLRKYNGIDRKSFPLFLKECEFRFNFGTPSEQLKVQRRWCGI